MMRLDNEKLAALEDEFNGHPNGIEQPNFVIKKLIFYNYLLKPNQ